MSSIRNMAGRIKNYLAQNGMWGLLQRVGQKLNEGLRYRRWLQKHLPDEETLRRQTAEARAEGGSLSILVPCYQTPPQLLDALVASVAAQSDPHWELCLYDGASQSQETRQALAKYAHGDPRIRVCFGTRNDRISGNTNHALDMATGDYIALLDHDDLLTPDAVFEVRKAIRETGAEILYSDEDLTNATGRRFFHPHMKPDFSPTHLNSCNYICHWLAMKRELAVRIGGLDSHYDGSQDHELVLRAIDACGQPPYHIPRVLYHWRMLSGSMSHQRLEQCTDASVRAVSAHLARQGIKAACEADGNLVRVSYALPEQADVSLLVLGREEQGAGFPDGVLAETLRPLPSEWNENPYVMADAMLRRAKGRFVLLMNPALRVCDPNAVTELLMLACQADVGAVGSRIQRSGGLTYEAGFAVGCGQGVARRGAECNFWVERTAHEVAAVPLDWMLVERDKALQAGGFAPRNACAAMEDVALCERLRAQGMRCVYTPHARVRFAGVRPRPLSSPKQASKQWLAECARKTDPFYSSLFRRKRANYRVV